MRNKEVSDKLQEMRDKRLKEPILPGDSVEVKVKHSKTGAMEGRIGKLIGFEGEKPIVSLEDRRGEVFETATHSMMSVGPNPFKDKSPWARMSRTNRPLDGLLMYAPGEVRDNGTPMREYNLDPFVIDYGGNRVYFQRGLVWSLDQKKNLIDSIYNYLGIGLFVARYNSFKRMTDLKAETGVEYSWDIIDGKQRITTIFDFADGKFEDSYGNVFSDLSPYARHSFYHTIISWAELGEDATDSDTIATFLAVNHTGAPMSREHIDHVKSIKF